MRNSGHAARTEVRQTTDSLRAPPKPVHFLFFLNFILFLCVGSFSRLQNPVSEAAEQRAGQAEEPELLHGVRVWTELVLDRTRLTETNPESRPPMKPRSFWTPRLFPPASPLFIIAFLLNVFTKLDTLGSGRRGPEAAPLQTVAFGLSYRSLLFSGMVLSFLIRSEWRRRIS